MFKCASIHFEGAVFVLIVFTPAGWGGVGGSRVTYCLCFCYLFCCLFMLFCLFLIAACGNVAIVQLLCEAKSSVNLKDAVIILTHLLLLFAPFTFCCD